MKNTRNLDGSFSIKINIINSVYDAFALLVSAMCLSHGNGEDAYHNPNTTSSVITYEVKYGKAVATSNVTTTDTRNLDGSFSININIMNSVYDAFALLVSATGSSHGNGEDAYHNPNTTSSVITYDVKYGKAVATSNVTTTDTLNLDGSFSININTMNSVYDAFALLVSATGSSHVNCEAACRTPDLTSSVITYDVKYGKAVATSNV